MTQLRKGADVSDTDRLHFIPEWAAKSGLTQAAITRELDINKSSVSRWFDGVMPRTDHLLALAALLGLPDSKMLFRHPDEVVPVLTEAQRRLITEVAGLDTDDVETVTPLVERLNAAKKSRRQ